MKIAFLSLNRDQLPDPVIPIGLLYLMANTAPEHERVLWDLCFVNDPLDYVRERIRAFLPDLIAVGMRNIQNGDYSGHGTNLDYYASVFAAIRDTSSAKVVLGGAGFSVMPQELMRHLRPDYGISGEGERAFAALVRVLDGQGGKLSEIGNLHYFEDGPAKGLLSSGSAGGPVPLRRAGGTVLISVPAAGGFLELDELVAPDRTQVDARYYTSSGTDSVQTKRGCPLHCNYCTYPLIEGRSIRQRDPARVVDEMIEARDIRGAGHIFVVDSVFNLPPKHAKAVCQEMIRRDFDLPWTCYANPIGFDQELAELMAAAGCAGIEVGSDSGVDEVLVRLRKGFKTDRIRALHACAESVSLPDCHTFILGTPGETLETVRATLDFCIELDPFAAIMMVWTDDYEALDPALAAQRRLFREEIKDLVRGKQAEFPRWIIPALSVNFDVNLFRLLRVTSPPGPLWQRMGRGQSSRSVRRRMSPSLT